MLDVSFRCPFRSFQPTVSESHVRLQEHLPSHHLIRRLKPLLMQQNQHSSQIQTAFFLLDPSLDSCSDGWIFHHPLDSCHFLFLLQCTSAQHQIPHLHTNRIGIFTIGQVLVNISPFPFRHQFFKMGGNMPFIFKTL